ncbi:MAG: hypothetical protein N2C14_25020, partial [Planctomycetales bacterium]
MIYFLQFLENIFNTLRFIISWPFRMLAGAPGFRKFSISTAFQAALLMFLALSVGAIVVTLAYYSDPYRIPWNYSVTSIRGSLIIAMIFVIPTVV